MQGLTESEKMTLNCRRVFKSEIEDALDFLTDVNYLASSAILDNNDAGQTNNSLA